MAFLRGATARANCRDRDGSGRGQLGQGVKEVYKKKRDGRGEDMKKVGAWDGLGRNR